MRRGDSGETGNESPFFGIVLKYRLAEQQTARPRTSLALNLQHNNGCEKITLRLVDCASAADVTLFFIKTNIAELIC